MQMGALGRTTSPDTGKKTPAFVKKGSCGLASAKARETGKHPKRRETMAVKIYLSPSNQNGNRYAYGSTMKWSSATELRRQRKNIFGSMGMK